MLEARTLNTAQMIIRSGNLAISFNRMISSRCGQLTQSPIRRTELRFLNFSFWWGQLNHLIIFRVGKKEKFKNRLKPQMLIRRTNVATEDNGLRICAVRRNEILN